MPAFVSLLSNLPFHFQCLQVIQTSIQAAWIITACAELGDHHWTDGYLSCASAFIDGTAL